MAKSAVLTSYVDKRDQDFGKPIWRARATFIYQTGDGNAAQALTLKNLNGTIKLMVVSISEVTDNPTVNVSLTDDLSAALVALTTLADATVHYKDADDWAVDELVVAGDLVISVTPSADPGGSGQTLTIIVEVRGV
jgi:hypothetical protein